MDKTRNIWPWLLCVLFDIALLAGVWLWGYHVGSSPTDTTDGGAVTKTETVTTEKASNPMPLKERSVGTVTVPVKLALKDPDEPTDLPKDEILVFVPENLKSGTRSNGYVPKSLKSGTDSNDIASKDTLRATIPVVQKEYRGSNYTAWVSGFMPKLDSIEVKSKVITIRETTTKRSRFNVGLTGGVGYGVFTRKPDVWVGVGMTWNIFK